MPEPTESMRAGLQRRTDHSESPAEEAAGRRPEIPQERPEIPQERIAWGEFLIWFRRGGDRVGHGICLAKAASSPGVLWSLEGDDQAIWPPSPPLQQLHVQHRDEKSDLALLLGMAGRSHWSLSVSPESASIVEFDAACRVHGAPEQLGSRYEFRGRCRQTSQRTARLVLEDGRSIVIDVLSLEGQPDTILTVENSHLQLQVQVRPNTPVDTVRWKYRLTLEPGTPHPP